MVASFCFNSTWSKTVTSTN